MSLGSAKSLLIDMSLNPTKYGTAAAQEARAAQVLRTQQAQYSTMNNAYTQRMQLAQMDASRYLSTVATNYQRWLHAGHDPADFWAWQRQAIMNDPNFHTMSEEAKSQVLAGVQQNATYAVNEFQREGRYDIADRLSKTMNGWGVSMSQMQMPNYADYSVGLGGVAGGEGGVAMQQGGIPNTLLPQGKAAPEATATVDIANTTPANAAPQTSVMGTYPEAQFANANATGTTLMGRGNWSTPEQFTDLQLKQMAAWDGVKAVSPTILNDSVQALQNPNLLPSYVKKYGRHPYGYSVTPDEAINMSWTVGYDANGYKLPTQQDMDILHNKPFGKTGIGGGAVERDNPSSYNTYTATTPIA